MQANALGSVESQPMVAGTREGLSDDDAASGRTKRSREAGLNYHQPGV